MVVSRSHISDSNQRSLINFNLVGVIAVPFILAVVVTINTAFRAVVAITVSSNLSP